LLVTGAADAVVEERMGPAPNTAIAVAASVNRHLRDMTFPPCEGIRRTEMRPVESSAFLNRFRLIIG
jgi:hypothetical protein